MSPYTCTVNSGSVSVDFFSTKNLYQIFSRSRYSLFIPEFSCVRNSPNSKSVIDYVENDSRVLRYASRRVSVSFPWREMRNGETILYLSYPLLERQRQENGFLTAHAAAFSLGDVAYLILGKEGAGKTSTLIGMCQTFGAKLVANDLCIVGWKCTFPVLQGGTKFLFMRRESARRTLPTLLKRFKQKSVEDPWLEKVILRPEDLEIELESRELKLGGTFLVHVDETKRTLFSRRSDDLPTRLYLNENFSRYIRTTSTTMLGGDRYDSLGYVPSLDTKRFYRWRQTLIRYLLDEQQGIRYVSGPLSLVAQEVHRLCCEAHS